MATYKAYYGVDFEDFDLNHYRNEFDSQQVVEDSTDKTNAGSDDRYSIWTDIDEAWLSPSTATTLPMTAKSSRPKGTVEAFSEWFYNTNPDEEAGEDFGATRIYLLKGIEVDLEDFIDVLLTNNTADDFDLLGKILSGDDDIKLSDYDDRAYGFSGADSMKGYDGDDVLYGDGGADTIKAGNDNDKAYGGSGADKLRGDKGDDKLWGENGQDDLKGGSGDDNLRGGDKADNIRGGSGRDKVWGEAGDDTFEFRTGDEEDIVQDWEANDTIDISRLSSVLNWDDLTLNHMSQVGDDVVIDGENGDILTLKDTDMATLTEADFIFQELIIT